MKVLSFSLLATVLLASINEQAESGLEVVGDAVPELVQQVEQPMLPIVVPGGEVEETFDVASDEAAIQVIEETVNDNFEDANMTHSSASASASTSASDDSYSRSDKDQKEDEEIVTEGRALSPNIESSSEDDADQPQRAILEPEDRSEVIERTSPHSPPVSSSSSSIEEADIGRPRVPQDISILTLLLEIFQTPVIMEMMTWSVIFLFLAIFFHQMHTSS